MRILVVEDEARMRKALCNGLKKYGYAVDAAVDGEKALELVEINTYDAVILDLNLPKIDGIEVLKGIRSMNLELRILILSARAAVEDKIMGLDTGSNDYLAKPFHFKELDARLRSLLRRDFIQKDTILTYGDIKIDTALRSVTVRNHKIELTKKEYSILEYLFMHKDRIVGTEELIEHIWDENKADLFSNSFKVQLNSLKKKLVPYTGDKELIKNTRGFGYSLAKEYADETVQ
ncbi:response regulator transcription factor [Paenibacillus nasutitermitis]|uniref:DNA-binding response regulator n=1 Tax=Paenibacillus nasutitermitis TaxID=1652958 RepID=A0A916ZDQ1_9BACL|nr:response regulator transcription factor [Paenibacillus nasutitermitis]GGD88522.1 DNA-binding response regulator [Paenibacillus nasutitermitis]